MIDRCSFSAKTPPVLDSRKCMYHQVSAIELPGDYKDYRLPSGQRSLRSRYLMFWSDLQILRTTVPANGEPFGVRYRLLMNIDDKNIGMASSTTRYISTFRTNTEYYA